MVKWIACTQEEYQKIIEENGGIDNFVVFSCYTEIAGFPRIFRDSIAEEDDVYTEWGRPNDTEPLVASRRCGTLTKPKWEYFRNDETERRPKP